MATAATKHKQKHRTPQGRTAGEAAATRAARSGDYCEAHDEYAAIRELRRKNWIAAHIRERRYELELTQQEVADAAETSHSYISRVEKGDHLPTLAVLKRILAVLDEDLLLTIVERGTRGERSKAARVPEVAGA